MDEYKKKNNWIPKTRLGRAVLDSKITSLKEIQEMGEYVQELEIINHMYPELFSERVYRAMVNRTTASGRRMRFKIGILSGDKKDCVGFGLGKNKEIAQSIKQAIDKSKLNLYHVSKGCGSWECDCGGEPHSISYKSYGRCGSVRVYLKPAPKGAGVVSSKLGRLICSLCGIKDIWVKTLGNTQTPFNFIYAFLKALKNIFVQIK